MPQRDLRGQRLKRVTLLHARGRLAQVAIEDLNTLGMPAQALGTLDQGPLRELTVEMLTHLLGAGLADVNHGFAFQVERRDVHLTEREMGMHSSSPQRVDGVAATRPRGARRGSAPCAR